MHWTKLIILIIEHCHVASSLIKYWISVARLAWSGELRGRAAYWRSFSSQRASIGRPVHYIGLVIRTRKTKWGYCTGTFSTTLCHLSWANVKISSCSFFSRAQKLRFTTWIQQRTESTGSFGRILPKNIVTHQKNLYSNYLNLLILTINRT